MRVKVAPMPHSLRSAPTPELSVWLPPTIQRRSVIGESKEPIAVNVNGSLCLCVSDVSGPFCGSWDRLHPLIRISGREPLLPVSNFTGHGVTGQGLKIILHKSCGFSVAGVLYNVHV